MPSMKLSTNTNLNHKFQFFARKEPLFLAPTNRLQQCWSRGHLPFPTKRRRMVPVVHPSVPLGMIMGVSIVGLSFVYFMGNPMKNDENWENPPWLRKPPYTHTLLYMKYVYKGHAIDWRKTVFHMCLAGVACVSWRNWTTSAITISLRQLKIVVQLFRNFPKINHQENTHFLRTCYQITLLAHNTSLNGLKWRGIPRFAGFACRLPRSQKLLSISSWRPQTTATRNYLFITLYLFQLIDSCIVVWFLHAFKIHNMS